VFSNYFSMNKTLINLVDSVDAVDQDGKKRLIMFLQWMNNKCIFFEKEKNPLFIPDSAFPNRITAFAYNKNSVDNRQLIDKYYAPTPDGEFYTLKKNCSLDSSDKVRLLGSLILIRGNVVWVEFGFNIGCEFGGKHPAVILKYLGDAIIVAPLSSGKLTNPRSYEVEIDKVYNLPQRDRYTNVTRITPVSIYRIDFTSPIGSVHSSKMRQILTAIKNEWGF
jgi:mRNA-degrading endonuclease toxin of MazEF toxin-antitoxin module